MAGSCILTVYLLLNDYLMYLYNTLCLISGVVILTFTIFINWKFDQWSEFTSMELINKTKIMCIIGLIICFIAVIGLCGMIRESSHILMLFTILQIIVVIGELVMSGIIYSHMDQIDAFVRNFSLVSMKQYNIFDQNDSTKNWDAVQSIFECCGTNKPNDWTPITGTNLPWSCCVSKPIENSCTVKSLNKSPQYVGCLYKLKKLLHTKANIIIWFVVGLTIVQILVLVSAYGRVTSLTSLHSKYKY